ncbi:MAG: sigma-70 family RNA polymerase sigma factor [Planctomycetota bacterium]
MIQTQDSPQLTQLIDSISQGDLEAKDSLLCLVYNELRQMATYQLSRERCSHTLQPTALVHEAFIKLFEGKSQPDWNSRAHFFYAAAEAMRRILVDHARKLNAKKRGNGLKHSGQIEDAIDGAPLPEEVLHVNDLLDQLEHEYPEKASVVRLRYFAGLTIPETASALELSVPTVNRYWSFARAWLFDKLSSAEESPSIQCSLR